MTLDQIELIEKSSLRTAVQALQQYSAEAKEIFETTRAHSKSEVIVLAEDLTEYALEVAETYPINRRYAGFIDYKRVRWYPTSEGLVPQVLLVDAKASTENNRDTLQVSQLPGTAEFRNKDGVVTSLVGEVEPYLELPSAEPGEVLHAITTSIFVHFYYRETSVVAGRYRELHGIYVIAVPHEFLKARYNPDPDTTFFGAGKHSPARGEVPRIRVYFTRLRAMRPWRLQQLMYAGGVDGYAVPTWRDGDSRANETNSPFLYLHR